MAELVVSYTTACVHCVLGQNTESIERKYLKGEKNV